MSRERLCKPEQAWRSRLLLVGIAFAVGFGIQPILSQESGVRPHDLTKIRPPSSAAATEDLGPTSPWGIRVVLILLGLAAWHATQRFLGGRRPAPSDQAEPASRFLTQQDGLLRLSEPVNRFLNAHPRWADALLVVSSALVDALGLWLFVWSIVGPSIRPFLGLCILFALRQLCQALTALPLPVGAIWRYPGFPSLFVTYGVSNDLFFSGHTALAVYGAIELSRMPCNWLVGLAIPIVFFEIAVMLLLRAHYTMDVFAGLMTALYVAGVAGSLALPCDRALTQAFVGVSKPPLSRSVVSELRIINEDDPFGKELANEQSTRASITDDP
jgi:hypothetical protein